MATASRKTRSRRKTAGSGQQTGRIDVRLSPERKALLLHAADLEGRSLSDFLLSAAQERAEKTIRRHEVLTLSVRDSHAFVEAVLNPPQPNERLRRAAERRRALASE